MAFDYRSQFGDPTQPDWSGKNLTVVTSPSGAKFSVHRAAAPSFTGFLQDLESTGYKVQSGGGYNLRPVTGGTTLSPHAYGAAIDINPAQNPYSKTPEGGVLKTDLPPQVSDLAAKWGLIWGGNWKSLKDPMHLEYQGSGGSPVVAPATVLADAGLLGGKSGPMTPMPDLTTEVKTSSSPVVAPSTSPSAGPNLAPLLALGLAAPKHKFEPIDYDPFKVEKDQQSQAPSGPGFRKVPTNATPPRLAAASPIVVPNPDQATVPYQTFLGSNSAWANG